MAINSSYYDENNQLQLPYTTSSKGNDLAPNIQQIKSFIGPGTVSGSNTKRQKTKINSNSAYISNDVVQLLSHHIQEKNTKTVLSSLQLAANIYKSNSDEFKSKKLGKKSNKKSVLTLPNERSALPQVCTVSDMNDSEYFDRDKPKVRKTKIRQRLGKNKISQPTNDYDTYNAKYCSQMNLYLDCSSTNVVKNFQGDGRAKRRSYDSKNKHDKRVAPHDVWAALRDINRFQFQPSPSMSEDSTVTLRKKKFAKKKIRRGVYETCRTEQIAYISSIKLNVKSPDVCLSESSSVDRITVIGQEKGLKKITEPVQDTFTKKIPQAKLKNNKENPIKQSKQLISKRISKNNNCKDLCLKKFAEMKTSDQREIAQLKSKTVKDDASIETLVALKPVISIKPTQTSNKYVDTFEDLPTLNTCSEVKIQTDPYIEHKVAANKTRIHCKVNGTYNATTNTGTLRNIIPIQNMQGNPDVKVPLRRPFLPSRVPWSIAQPRYNQTPTRPEPTKTIITPGKALTFSKLDDSPKALQYTTTKNTDFMHPFTQSDIRRALAKYKFPLIILGTEQLGGALKVDDYDYPQFDGLDEHVWPFMLDWSDTPNKLIQPDRGDCSHVAGKRNNYNECNFTIDAKPAHCPNKRTFNDQHILTDVNASKVNKTNKNLDCKQKGVTKMKPILQFRDKMLKLLYKKSSNQNIPNGNPSNCVQGDEKTVNPVQINSNKSNLRSNKTATDISNNSAVQRYSISRPSVGITKPQPPSPLAPTSPSKLLIPQINQGAKRNWGKAKWVSDFIENVIKKIKNGTYYTDEFQCKPSNTEPLENVTRDTNDLNLPVNESKEVSIQVAMPVKSGDFTPKITIQKKKASLVNLPGFDDTVPQLEIKSMTRNQIAVKNCVTNIILQFDVKTPLEGDQHETIFKRSLSCIPVSVTESKTRVFKCKARILNAMLPAELCSILPKVMKQLMIKDTHLALTLHEENRINTSLRPISEYTVPQIEQTEKLPLLLHIEEPQIFGSISSEAKNLWDGRFSKIKLRTEKSNSNEKFYIIAIKELPYHSIETVLLRRPVINYPDYFKAHLDHPPILNITKQKSTITLIRSVQKSTPETTNLCRDLVPYTKNEIVLGGCTNVHNVLRIMSIEFFRMINQMNTSSVLDCSSLPSIKMRNSNNHISLNFNIKNHQGIGTSLSIDLNNLILTPICNATTTYLPITVKSGEFPVKRIEYIKHAEEKEFKVTAREKPQLKKALKGVLKNKGSISYVKLYKKCKSTSHIEAERSSTSLSKVTNLEEFFQALGTTGKLLSSAFDGSCGRKILSCVAELKNWITDITPRQALLVMLLTNKKETSNLIRFKPILLQGIAVNRITRVSELDMEIEVIERERFNKLSEYPGIPSILESTQNNDNLLEELYWIAKTTASDFQRRFDASSEKLLKALFEKRKKLNPSYLRVMARYVGLGLLKTPTPR